MQLPAEDFSMFGASIQMLSQEIIVFKDAVDPMMKHFQAEQAMDVSFRLV